MYDESTETYSAANLEDLKHEAYLLISWDNRAKYPNLAILSDEYQNDLHKRQLIEVASEYYNKEQVHGGQKISFIKYLRTRFDKLDLLSAKMMADGFWMRFDADKERNKAKCKYEQNRDYEGDRP
jgi:hypothetical protein